MTKSVSLRGGSWYDFPWDCRSAYRTPLVPGIVDYLVGFRVVCVADKKPIEHVLLRGGAWISYPCDCRSAYRDRSHPDFRNNPFGFRVCCPAAKTNQFTTNISL